MENKNGKSGIIIAIVILLAVFVLGLLTWDWRMAKSLEKIKKDADTIARQEELAKSADERMIEEATEDKNIIISSPEKGETISSPLAIVGQINGGGWSGFEGQAGTVQLLDADGKVVSTAILEPTTDWMRLPTKFKATLNFSSPAEQNGTLVFKNENPSGMPENDRELKLLVKIGKTN